jgi:hypothetical protein
VADTLSIRITFKPTLGKLAAAMAIKSREECDGAWGEYVTEDPIFVEYVEAMTKAQALKALRESFWAYGAVSWPDDWPHEAYKAALRKARAWFEPQTAS